MHYNLELDKAIEEVKNAEAKKVCIQLPDGLKKQAQSIADEISSKTGAEVIIWMGTCFGSCDSPMGLEKLGVDLLLAWGHSRWIPPKERFK